MATVSLSDSVTPAAVKKVEMAINKFSRLSSLLAIAMIITAVAQVIVALIK